MKRIISIILTFILMFSLTACTETEKTDTQNMKITDEEREILKKPYDELDDNDLATLSIIGIKIDKPESGATQEDKDNYYRIQKEKDEYMERLSEGLSTETDRKDEIRSVIKQRIDEGEYDNAKLDTITINDNLGDGNETYIALIYFEFDIKNKKETANEVMRMYSDDLVATLVDQGIDDVAEAAIFWKDSYNDRDVKYAYEYKDGKFRIADIAGE